MTAKQASALKVADRVRRDSDGATGTVVDHVLGQIVIRWADGFLSGHEPSHMREIRRA